MPNSTKVPAIAYLRMSTDLQEYSTENQLACIKKYATQHNFEILRIYADEGISGLTLSGRGALRTVMTEVKSGEADFKAILVYDVSRWGRFQEADEAAFHEHACAQAGIRVHYCAEIFKNDGSFDTSVFKSIKRAMAAEYIRSPHLQSCKALSSIRPSDELIGDRPQLVPK